ncbi:MAG TPA: hypothetical protein VHQ70_01385 [Syntrophomonadaceae bacterium]|nr:hypothetical protein [Syntrophomonadaceae bacterium]
MDYSQVSLNKIILNIASPQGDGIIFNKGEILKGIVQEVKDNGLVMLFIKGRLIEAASEVAVKSGQQMYLMVDESRDGRICLKVVTPQQLDEIENANLSASLRNQGIASSQENIQIARKLLDYNLPVTSSNLTSLSRTVRMLGGYSPRNLEIAAFTLARDIVPSQSAVTAMEQFVTNQSNDVIKLFNEIKQILTLIDANNSDPENNLPAALPKDTILPDSVRGQLSGLGSLSMPLEADPDWSDQLSKAVQTTGRSAEGTLSPGQNHAETAVNLSLTDPGQAESLSAGETNKYLLTNKTSASPFTPEAVLMTNENQDSAPAGSGQTAQANNLAEKVILPFSAADKTSQDVSAAVTNRSLSETLDPAQKIAYGSAVVSATDTTSVPADAFTNIISNLPEVLNSVSKISDGPIMALIDPDLKQTFNLVRELIDSVTLKGEDPPQVNIQKLAALIKSEPELIKNLQMLTQIVRNIKPEVHSPVIQELVSRLESLGKEITGQRLFNIVADTSGDNVTSSYYFSVPLYIKDELRLCQLKIHHDSKRSLQLQDRIRFIVSLDTQNLGLVLFYVDWKRVGELNLQGVVENHTALSRLNKNSNTLLEKLQALGYRVNFSGLKLARPDEMEHLRPELGKKPAGTIKPFCIDVII